MGTILSDAEIVRISKILSEDSEAVSQRKQIYGSLGILLADLPDLETNVYLTSSGPYGFFTQALLKYRSTEGSSGTVEKIIECLRDLKLISVVEKIEKTVGKTVSKSIWFNVKDPVASFTGREAEISKLHELLIKNAGNVTVINQVPTVSGLGGIGKSEIAKKYAHDYKSHYHGNVIWIDAETRESCRNSVQLLFKLHIDIPEEISKSKTDKELIGILYDRFSNKKCLIIFDNYEQFNVLKLLPKKSRRPTDLIPNVLITSRNSSWEFGIQVLKLDVLTAEEAVKFVEKQIPTSEPNDTVKLVTELQRFPLALQQAVAYIKAELSEEPNPIEKYLQLFDEQDVSKLLNYTNEESLSQNEKTTFSTWLVTLQSIKLRESDLLATRIINLVSCLEPSNIPKCIFENMKSSPVEFLTVPTEAAAVSTAEVNVAIALLKKYFMISGRDGVINVHRLVQRVVRLNIENNIESVLVEGLELLEQYMHPYTNNDDLVKSILPHAESIWKISVQYPNLKSRYGYFPIYLCDKLYGRYADGDIKRREAEALNYLDEREREGLEKLDLLLAIEANKFGPEHERFLTGSHNKAEALFKIGRVNESLQLMQNVYEVNKRVLGEEDANTLNSRYWIARILFEKELFGEAFLNAETVYEARKRVLGGDHPHTMLFLNLLQLCRRKIAKRTKT